NRQKIVRTCKKSVGDLTKLRRLLERRNGIVHQVANRLLCGDAGLSIVLRHLEAFLTKRFSVDRFWKEPPRQQCPYSTCHHQGWHQRVVQRNLENHDDGEQR